MNNSAVGGGCNYASLPLWWADYNSDPGFGGFQVTLLPNVVSLSSFLRGFVGDVICLVQ